MGEPIRSMDMPWQRSEVHRSIVDGAVLPIVATTAQGVVVYMNPAAQRMLGVREEAVVGKRHLEEFHLGHEIVRRATELSSAFGVDVKPGFDVFVARLGYGLPSEHEWTWVRSDGLRLRVSLSMSPMRDTDGELVGYVGIASEIPLETLRRSAARSSERVFRNAFDHAPIGIALVSPEGTWLDVNESLCRIVGYSKSEMLGMTFLDITHPDDLDGDLAHSRELLEGKRLEYQMEKRYIHKEGREVWVLLSVTLLWTPEGSPEFFVAQIQDITERKRMEEMLRAAKDSAEKAVAARSAFLAMVSHEIRTPLNGVIGFGHLLADTQLTDEQRSYVQSIHSGSDSLLKIINDILDYSKMEAGKIQLQEVPFDLRTCVSGTVNLMSARASAKGVTVSGDVDMRLPNRVVGDEMRLSQVLNNLVSNAVKFTDNGTVTVSVNPYERADGWTWMKFIVSDTGPGIPENRLGDLFEPFVQLDASITRQHGGTGLGLSICRKLSEQMGGTLWLESQVGVGTAAHLLMPLRPAADDNTARSGLALIDDSPKASDSEPRSKLPELSYPARSVRVLLAEDNVINRMFMERLFGRLGVEDVTVATDGLEAIEKHESADFDLVLMDCQMPRLDGYEATRRIRKAERTDQARKRAFIVALTASAMEEDRQRALDAGMDDYISKPLRPEWLAATLERAANNG